MGRKPNYLYLYILDFDKRKAHYITRVLDGLSEEIFEVLREGLHPHTREELATIGSVLREHSTDFTVV